MIPNTSELIVLNAKWNAGQKRKNDWKTARLDALEFYKGRSLPYTMNYFDDSLFKKVPASTSMLLKELLIGLA